MPWDRVHSGGYVFQIETTYLASRAGAKVVETPIVFTDRRVGVSKMSRRIIGEALMVVIRLRWEELRGRGPTAVRVDSVRRRRRVTSQDGSWLDDRRSGAATRRARGARCAAAPGA